MSKIYFSSKELAEIVERASTIRERLNCEFVSDGCQENNAIINSRIEQWCQVAALGNWEKFKQRLAWDNLDLSTIRPVLGSVRMSDKQQLPAWAETLNKCVKAVAEVALETKVAPRKNNFLNPRQPFPFEEFLVPFVYVARQNLIAQAGSYYELLSKEVHASLEHRLLISLSYLCSPSLASEFSVFRASRQSTIARLQGELTGNYSTQQYRGFIQNLLTGEVLTFFREYPVLARLIATTVDLWVDATKEFLCCLSSDWTEIHNTFQAEAELGQVVAVESFLSDRHHGGRSVMAVTFASGLKIIYKPRNLDIEQGYVKVLVWLNEHGLALPFKLLKVLNRPTYGWVEFVEAKPCKDKEEVKRYYQRTGMLLCLVYVLEATDLHFQNIVACGEHPVLIDLETLMHPKIQEVEELEASKKAYYLANKQLWHSVLRTGLLPRWQFDSENQSFDLSGLGGADHQEQFFRVPTWHNINTDNMALGYKYIKNGSSAANAPSLEGVKLSLDDYLEEIVDGFQIMYQFLMKHRNEILAPDSPLTALAHQPIRFIFRPTKIYSFILTESLEPKFLQDGIERSINLDILSRVMLLSETKPLFWPLLSIEKQALEQMDIPLFTARSDSDALTLTPAKTIEKCFTEPSFNLVVSRLNRLDYEDLKQQISFIRGLLYSRTVVEAHRSLSSENVELDIKAVVCLPASEILLQATAIALDLQKQAICSADGSVTWIAPQYILEAQRFQLQPMGHSLYDGGLGVALFLVALETVIGSAGFRNLALGVLQPLRLELQESTSNQIAKNFGLGGAMGCGSIIYGLVRISQFLDEPVLLQSAQKVASVITPDCIAADQKFDIISGAAGAILGLLALHNISPAQEVLDHAIACGYHLLNHRVASDSSYKAWATFNGKLLTGFSHGAAGIAYALLRLYQVTGETIFLEAAQEAITYERSVFSPEMSNWPDFRESSTKESPIYMCSWCHGAPGIGLARVAGLDILDTAEIRQDIEAAVNTTSQHKLSGIDHLCCGNLGRVEFLFTAARKLSQPQLLKTVMEQTAQVVARATQRGGFAYGPTLSYNPGFFQGAAGIGYELLRLAYPDQLPSVLLWE